MASVQLADLFPIDPAVPSVIPEAKREVRWLFIQTADGERTWVNTHWLRFCGAWREMESDLGADAFATVTTAEKEDENTAVDPFVFPSEVVTGPCWRALGSWLDKWAASVDNATYARAWHGYHHVVPPPGDERVALPILATQDHVFAYMKARTNAWQQVDRVLPWENEFWAHWTDAQEVQREADARYTELTNILNGLAYLNCDRVLTSAVKHVAARCTDGSIQELRSFFGIHEAWDSPQEYEQVLQDTDWMVQNDWDRQQHTDAAPLEAVLKTLLGVSE